MTTEDPGVAGAGTVSSGEGSAAALARALFEALARHDLDAVRGLDAPDVVDDFVAVGVYAGVDAVIGFFEELFTAVPDFSIEVLDVTAEDDTAAVQWRANGSVTGGPFQGIHPTGRRIDLRGIDVMRFEGGLLKHNTIYYDGLAFARQTGLFPSEGSRADRALQAVFDARTDARVRGRGLRR